MKKCVARVALLEGDDVPQDDPVPDMGLPKPKKTNNKIVNTGDTPLDEMPITAQPKTTKARKLKVEDWSIETTNISGRMSL